MESAMSEKRPNRRSIWNYFTVEQGFKQRQILRLLGLTLANVAISTVAFVMFMDYELSALRSGSPVTAWAQPSLLRIAVVWAALMSGLGGLFALLTGLFLTHRMAGPIYTFKKELRRIEEGHAPRRIGVRTHDEFKDVAEALNRALEAVHARSRDVAESGELALDLERARSLHLEILEGLEALDPDGLADADRARLEAWRERMKGLRAKLDA